MNPLTRRLTLLGHAFQRPFLRRRLGRLTLETLDGVPLIVLPEVFNPVLFRTGTVLARTVASSPWAQPRRRARGRSTWGPARAWERSSRPGAATGSPRST